VSLSPRDVDHIAHLARLALSDEERADLLAKLSRILGLVDELRQVDARDVPPMAHPLDMVQRLRSDRVTEIDQREVLQRNAPQVTAGVYLVPRVIE
jgi:aspartyl-tRNA(Asn)/glutamyl-tRNA(Gln) amidotransferase subunit C